MKRLKSSIVSLLRIRVILVIQYFIITIAVSAEVKTDTLSFLHITDSHIIFNLPGYHPNIEKERKHFGEGVRPLSQFLMSIRKEIQTDFVVITGDLIDFYEAETPDGGKRDTQIEQFIRLLDISYLPVYLTLGNHDIASDYVKANSYDTHQYNAERARAAWIRNATCFRDGTCYSRVFKVDTTVYRFIFLDDGYSPAKTGRDDEFPVYIDRAQLDWLDNQMHKSATDVEIIFMHIPLPDSSKISARLSRYNTSGTDLNNILSLLIKNSSARLIFAGHNHKNIINEFHFPDNYKLTQVQTAAFGYDPKNWRVIQLTGENILISYPGSTEIQSVIKIR